MIDEETIRKAVEAGNHQYWEDGREQDRRVREWKEAGSVGPFPEAKTGSIVNYITASVMKAITTPDRETA
jgi:hypothetical protein